MPKKIKNRAHQLARRKARKKHDVRIRRAQIQVKFFADIVQGALGVFPDQSRLQALMRRYLHTTEVRKCALLAIADVKAENAKVRHLFPKEANAIRMEPNWFPWLTFAEIGLERNTLPEPERHIAYKMTIANTAPRWQKADLITVDDVEDPLDKERARIDELRKRALFGRVSSPADKASHTMDTE